MPALRADPRRFSALLEDTIGANREYFVPAVAPQELSNEERKLHGRRLEDLIDEAVCLAGELYPGRRRDAALLSIAAQAERLMKRLWVDPWGRSQGFLTALMWPGQRDRTAAWGSLSLVQDHAVCCCEDPS